MSARAPRRSFSRSFVVTLAATPACFVQSSTPPSQSVSQPAPGQPETTDPRPQQPPPETQSPVIIANPPRPQQPPPGAQAPQQPVEPPASQPVETKWFVTKTGADCRASTPTTCPPHAICNPPPPMPYTCLDGFSYPLEITMVNGSSCTAVPHRDCPMNAKCKMPDPVSVPCPHR